MNRNTLPRRRSFGARFTRDPAEGGGGGTGEGQTGGQSGEQSAAGSGEAAAQAGEQQGQQTGRQTTELAAQWDGKVESLPEPVQKMIRDLRTENGSRRTALTGAEEKQQEMVRAFAKAAGITLPDDQQAPDPAALTEQLTASQSAARQSAVELAVYRTAGKHSGDPDALLDSRSFLNALNSLDPAADDFAANVDTAIKAAVDGNPKLKAGRAPGASGADHTGGPGEGGTFRKPTSLHDAVAQSYGT